MLKYVGDVTRNEYIPGVPARDLTDDEAKQYPEAAKSPLYKKSRGTAASEV